jgi:EAL domain-containing protein (putative c-di-GMP-specific phosphodiesterase class I)
LVEDHWAIKRIIRPMSGFKEFHCARIILSGIEVMHMIGCDELQGFLFSKALRASELQPWTNMRAVA